MYLVFLRTTKFGRLVKFGPMVFYFVNCIVLVIFYSIYFVLWIRPTGPVLKILNLLIFRNILHFFLFATFSWWIHETFPGFFVPSQTLFFFHSDSKGLLLEMDSQCKDNFFFKIKFLEEALKELPDIEWPFYPPTSEQ